MKVFVGKQPIVGLNDTVMYYELLYRSSSSNNFFSNTDQDQATIDVLLNAFLTIGLDKLTNNKPCFVNFSENLLMHDMLESFDPNFLVIEILETVPITPKIIERIRYLKSKGFRFALDDFFIQANVTCYEELFGLIDFIKMDFLNSHVDERLLIENMVHYQFPHITLLAEKIEVSREFEEAKNAGYRLFQGYYFEKPEVVTHTEIPVNIINYYEILSILNINEPNIEKLSQIIKRDVSLTLKILQLANAISPSSTRINSIKQAIMLIGFKELYKWIYLLSIRASMETNHSELFEEVIYNSLIRAKICELLAVKKNKNNVADYYLLGMFSSIETILQQPMDKIVKNLPFSEEMLQTLLGKETPMTAYLQFSIALQQLDWDTIGDLALQLDYTSEQAADFYFEAITWAKDFYLYKHILES